MTTQIAQLVEQRRAANLAYRGGQPNMTDYEYDQLEAAIRSIDPEHPCLREISDDDDSEFQQEQPLTLHMGSQNKALAPEEMLPFFGKVQGPYNASFKMDGLSAEATYRAGVLTQVLTRGDGVMGRNITIAARHIPTLPASLPEAVDCVIRGEIYLRKSQFEVVNQLLKAEGRDVLTAVRNGAVAIVRSRKNEAYAKYLDFSAFDIETI